MIFQVGKCYQHTTGRKIRMLCEIETNLLFAVLDGMARQLKKGGEQTDDN